MLEEKNVRLLQTCDMQEGVNKKGDAWRKITAVFETNDHYPRKIAVTAFNSMCETVCAFTPGALFNIQFDLESRSWTNPNTNKERWFTEATLRTCVPAVAKTPTMENFDKPLPPINPADDLPF